MPYCPECRSEYRAGITSCPTCGGVALVDVLPEPKHIREEEFETAKAVGMTGDDQGQVVVVDGQQIDTTRVFVLDTAAELKDLLDAANVPSAIVPLEMIEFPDQRPRFQVRVREADLPRAQEVLGNAWREQVEREGIESGDATDIEKCPACGAHVPLDVDECPDCGLVVGR